MCKLEDLYVHNNSIEQSKGRGCIYIKDRDIRKMETDEEYLLRPNETYMDAASLSHILGIKVSKILKQFADENYSIIEKSSLNDDKKREMCDQLHMAKIVEELRMKHSKLETTRCFRDFE